MTTGSDMKKVENAMKVPSDHAMNHTHPANLTLPEFLSNEVERVQASMTNVAHPQRFLIARQTNEICQVQSADNLGDGFSDTSRMVELMRCALARKEFPFGIDIKDECARLPPYIAIVNFCGERYVFHSSSIDGITSLCVSTMVLAIGATKTHVILMCLAMLETLLVQIRSELVEKKGDHDACLVLFYSIPKYSNMVDSRYWELRMFRRMKMDEHSKYTVLENGVCMNSVLLDARMAAGDMLNTFFASPIPPFEEPDKFIRLAEMTYDVVDLDETYDSTLVERYNHIESMRTKLIVTQDTMRTAIKQRDGEVVKVKAEANRLRQRRNELYSEKEEMQRVHKAEVDKLNETLRKMSSTVDKSNRSVREKNDEITNMMTLQRKLSMQVEALEQQVSANNELEEAYNALKCELKQRDDSIASLTSRLMITTEELERTRSKTVAITAEFDTFKEVATVDLNTAMKNKSEEITCLTKDLNQLKETVQSMDTLKTELSTSKEEVKLLQIALDEAKEECTRLSMTSSSSPTHEYTSSAESEEPQLTPNTIIALSPSALSTPSPNNANKGRSARKSMKPLKTPPLQFQTTHRQCTTTVSVPSAPQTYTAPSQMTTVTPPPMMQIPSPMQSNGIIPFATLNAAFIPNHNPMEQMSNRLATLEQMMIHGGMMQMQPMQPIPMQPYNPWY